MTSGSTGYRPQTAFVLAAGLGTRMRPLTDRMPKPMVPLAGRPLIDHVLDRLGAAGIDRVVVNLHYLADLLQDYLASRSRPEILFSDEREEVLDTGGGVAKALPLLGDKPFIVHNSDSVWLEESEVANIHGRLVNAANGEITVSNLARLIASWDANSMDCLLMLAPVASSLGYSGAGDFDLLPDNLLRRRLPKGKAPYVFAGVSIIHPKLFADAPVGPFSLNQLWNKAMQDGRLKGICAKGIWMHVGDPAALELAGKQFTAGR